MDNDHTTKVDLDADFVSRLFAKSLCHCDDLCENYLLGGTREVLSRGWYVRSLEKFAASHIHIHGGTWELRRPPSGLSDLMELVTPGPCSCHAMGTTVWGHIAIRCLGSVPSLMPLFWEVSLVEEVGGLPTPTASVLGCSLA